jgi:hypothetical protein
MGLYPREGSGPVGSTELKPLTTNKVKLVVFHFHKIFIQALFIKNGPVKNPHLNLPKR